MKTSLAVSVLMFLAILSLSACGGKDSTQEAPVLEVRGVWNPGTLPSGAISWAKMDVPGAKSGDECMAGVLDPAPVTGFQVQCIISTDICTIGIRNQQTNTLVFGSATFYCRVYKPGE